jgi:ketosteroid isomerase-like protein
MRPHHSAIVFVLAVAALAPRHALSQKSSTNATARQAIEQAIAGLSAAIVRGDAAAAAAFYTEDVRVVQSGFADTQGRAQVQKEWERNFAQTNYANPQMPITRFHVSGGLAITGGTATLVGRAKDGTRADTAAFPYLAAWARQPNGRWLLQDLVLASPPK